jgi:hypothetical protein
MKIEGSGSICQKHGSADPDPHQNVMDPQHWHSIQSRSYIFFLLNDLSAIPTFLLSRLFCTRMVPRYTIMNQ